MAGLFQMDILAGRSAVSQALRIAKELRDIDRGVDEASFKLKVAELQTALADAKIALSDAKLLLNEKDGQIRQLNGRIAALEAGEICPLCSTDRMKVAASRAHPEFGVFGKQERELRCDNSACGHVEKHLFDSAKKAES